MSGYRQKVYCKHFKNQVCLDCFNAKLDQEKKHLVDALLNAEKALKSMDNWIAHNRCSPISVSGVQCDCGYLESKKIIQESLAEIRRVMKA